MSKMYCIVSREGLRAMKGNVGKLVSQAGHAYLHAWWDLDNLISKLDKTLPYSRSVQAYRNTLWRLEHVYRYGPTGATKIALVVDTDKELEMLYKAYQGKTGTTLVVDEGRTVFDFVPTQTALGIGPLTEDMIGDDLKSLPLLSEVIQGYAPLTHC